jgi:hypothetical protein
MGIDYKVVSLTDTDYESKLGENVYLKYAWRDLDWRPVFDFLHINLDLLYDSSVNYWSECQVVDIRDHLIALINKDDALLMNLECLSHAENLRNNAVKLLHFFEDYVAHNARIYVF